MSKKCTNKTCPFLLLMLPFLLIKNNISFHIDLAKNIHNGCDSFSYYKKFRYIQTPTDMHAGNHKLESVPAILFGLGHGRILCMHYAFLV